jgi:hypothetical protein
MLRETPIREDEEASNPMVSRATSIETLAEEVAT